MRSYNTIVTKHSNTRFKACFHDGLLKYNSLDFNCIGYAISIFIENNTGLLLYRWKNNPAVSRNNLGYDWICRIS